MVIARGRKPALVVKEPAYAATWSPDGTAIAYTTAEGALKVATRGGKVIEVAGNAAPGIAAFFGPTARTLLYTRVEHGGEPSEAPFVTLLRLRADSTDGRHEPRRPPSDRSLLSAIPECRHQDCLVRLRHDGLDTSGGRATMALVELPPARSDLFLRGRLFLITNRGEVA